MFPSLTRDEVFRIETRRLWLRWPRHEDAAVMASWIGLPKVASMTNAFRVGISAAEMAAFIADNRKINGAGRGMMFVVVPQGRDDDVIGRVGVGLNAERQLAIGYQLSPARWGEGLMSEAVAALCAQVFELSSVKAITAAVRPENGASIQVLEKNGFVHTGSAIHDSPVYGPHGVDTFALARARPSALLTAQQRFRSTMRTTHDLVGLV